MIPEESLLPRIGRRFALWLVLCTISAAPSFLWAAHEFNTAAMVFGVFVFVVLYTIATCTPQFERFKNRPFIRRTLYIGYGTRALVSVFYPAGMALDLIPGMMSVSAVQSLGIEPHTFAGTFATTLVQGAALNVVVALYMLLLVYPILRILGIGAGGEMRGHGFPVIMNDRAGT